MRTTQAKKGERPIDKKWINKEDVSLLEKILEKECYIKPFEMKGTIIGIYMSKKGIEYQVRYYINAEQKTEYFFGWEIKEGE